MSKIYGSRTATWGGLVLVAGGVPGVAFAETVASGWPITASGGMSAAYLAQMVVGLLLVIVAIVVLAFFMRRMSGVQSALGSQFRVVSGLSLGSRERIVLVQVGEQQLLVGVAPGRVQTLHVLEVPLGTESGRDGTRANTAAAVGANPAGAGANSPFARKLQQLLQRSP